MGCSKSRSKREVHSDKCQSLETSVTDQINNLTSCLKELDTEGQTKPKVRENEITKMRAEISEVVTKKKIERIKENKSIKKHKHN